METVVIVAIGVLATIFLASFVALVVVCRQRYCRTKNLLTQYNNKPTVDLIGAMETQSEPSDLELDDVVITNPHIEAILEDEDWIEDASITHSTLIFLFPQWPRVSLHFNSKGRMVTRICHTLTEKLVAMTMGSGAKMKTPSSLSDIIVVAKRISPRCRGHWGNERGQEHCTVNKPPYLDKPEMYMPAQGNLALRRRVLRRTENELQSNIAASMQPAGWGINFPLLI
ncbi:unnamed protein product [Ranitomeya imitator]|uniref:Transmembrane protein 98 n=1 Tax=Ranitomeya imitator TaxID=111125 RepID=A0ABN9L4F8_9NEOB|nr:unnamed protein product [Ranitomeya imitator]